MPHVSPNPKPATSLCFISFGVVLAISVDEPELLPALSDYLPPGWRPIGRRPEALFSITRREGRRRLYTLRREQHVIVEGARLSLVLDMLEAAIRQYVAEMSPLRIFVHAGVVAWHGKAIVIPGRSMSGKTTLVRELVRAGASYYSDEYAVFDARGRVHPYASPLGIRQGEGLQQRRVPIESLKAQVGRSPIRVGLILITRYREGARLAPRQLTAGNGALELLNNTVPARRFPDRVMPVLGRAVEGAAILKSARGDAKEAIQTLLAVSG